MTGVKWSRMCVKYSVCCPSIAESVVAILWRAKSNQKMGPLSDAVGRQLEWTGCAINGSTGEWV